MNSLRKWLYKPRKEDTALLAQFYYVEEELTEVLNELDSFDGRKEPERCQQLVTNLRACQDKALSLITKMIQEALPSSEQAARDFRAKFPDDVLHDNLAGQLWFGAECLAAGSNILNRESESSSMRPLAKAVTRQLDTLRVVLREQSLTNPRIYSEKVKDALRVFDNMFAEFEISYVSAMVPVKSVKEYEQHQNVIVLFSETLQRALKLKLVDQEQLDMCDPALMFTIPRLVIVYGLLMQPETPILCVTDSTLMPPMFKHFTRLLRKIRDLLVTLNYQELYWLEMCLARAHDPNEQEINSLPRNTSYEQWQQTDVAGTQAQRQMAEIELIFASNTELKQLIDDIVAYIQYSAAKYGTRKRRHIDLRLVRKVRAKQIKYGKAEARSVEDEETAVLEQACEIGGRLSSRNHFKSTLDLIQRLYVCISGVADQLHHNFPADLRSILKTVFLVHQSSDDDDDEEEDEEEDASGGGDDEDTQYVPSAEASAVVQQQQRRKAVSADAASSMSSNVQNSDAVPLVIADLTPPVHTNSTSSHLQPMSPIINTSGVIAAAASMPTSHSAPALQLNVHARVMEDAPHSPPAWVPDEYAVSCHGCAALFTFVRRRHHCRNCGQVYCSNCCGTFVPLPRFGYGERPVRVCKRCRASVAEHVSAATIPVITPSNRLSGRATRTNSALTLPSRRATVAETEQQSTHHTASLLRAGPGFDHQAGRISPTTADDVRPAASAVGAIAGGGGGVSLLSANVSSALHATGDPALFKAAIAENNTLAPLVVRSTDLLMDDDDMSPLTVTPLPRGPCASTAFSSSTPIPPIMEDTTMALAQATIQQDAARDVAVVAENAASQSSVSAAQQPSSAGSRRRITPPMLMINNNNNSATERNTADSGDDADEQHHQKGRYELSATTTPRLQSTSAEHIETLNHLLSPSSFVGISTMLAYDDDAERSADQSDGSLLSPAPFLPSPSSNDSPVDIPLYRERRSAGMSPLALTSGTGTNYRPSRLSLVHSGESRLLSGGSDNDLDAMFHQQTIHHAVFDGGAEATGN